ncbi:MAG: hypothetical protein ACRDYB_04615 [Acidimicrobiales bacterium]
MEKRSEPITPGELKLARSRLSFFVQREALTTARELGFGWRPSSVTPHGLEGLTEELRSCHVSGLPFRVLKDHSDDVVFTSPSGNWAMRYWHDTRHVWLGADFTTESELAVASCHLARARSVGLHHGSLAYALLQADTVGQTLFVARTHSFVVHQLQFAIDCARLSFDEAIEREVLRRTVEGTAA